MIDPAFETIVLLMLAALAAGCIDSIAGGGALITTPALLLAGFPPVDALGTNKLQGLFGSGSATIAYASKGHVDVRQQAWPAVLAFLGSVAGAAVATILPADVLRVVLPFLLMAIAVYFAIKPDPGEVERMKRLSPFVFGITLVPLIGFYDGVFGPGTGSFFMMAFVALQGVGVLKATANTKLLNFASNLGGLAAFAVAGAIAWKVGLLMGVAQFVGARIGASLAMRIGARLIKPLLILVCIAMIIRLLADPTHPLRLWAGF